MLKFVQKEVTTKDFYGQKQITYIFTIDVNKLVVSDQVPFNDGKGYCYIVGCQADWVMAPLFIKIPKNVFNYGVSQYNKNSAYIQCHLMSLRKKHGRISMKRFGMRLSQSYLKEWRQNQ